MKPLKGSKSEDYVRNLVRKLFEKGKLKIPKEKKEKEEEEEKERIGISPEKIIKKSLFEMEPESAKKALEGFLKAEPRKIEIPKTITAQEASEVITNLKNIRTRYEERYFDLLNRLSNVNKMLGTIDEDKAHKIAKRLKKEFPDFAQNIEYARKTRIKIVKKFGNKFFVFESGEKKTKQEMRPLTKEEKKRVKTLKTAKRTFYWIPGKKLKKAYYRIRVPSSKLKIPLIEKARRVSKFKYWVPKEVYERPEIIKIKKKAKAVRMEKRKLESLDKRFDRKSEQELKTIGKQLKMLRNAILHKTKFGPKQDELLSQAREKILAQIPKFHEKEKKA